MIVFRKSFFIFIKIQWNELYNKLIKLKINFDKSNKSLTQNRTIQQHTLNKHAEILEAFLNKARILTHDQSHRLDKNRWSQDSKFLIRWRSNLITIK